MAELETYLFVHIPKTAGTSFRLGVEAAFGADRVVYDYGRQAPATSDVIQRHVYGELDLDALRAHLVEQRVALLGGHVIYPRYAKLFAPSRVITFVREPVGRVVSEFEHARRLQGYQGTLLEFASIQRNRNLQASMMVRLGLRQLAAVGVTERYAESLWLIEQRIGWAVPELVRNLNPARLVPAGSYDLTDEEERQLRLWNSADADLYRRAGALLDQQLRREGGGEHRRPSSSRPRGLVGRFDNGVLHGWAFYVGDRLAARVRVEVNGEPRVTVPAAVERPDLREKGLHPTGNAGFRAKLGELVPGTEIRCFFDDTDRELSRSPLIVGDE